MHVIWNKLKILSKEDQLYIQAIRLGFYTELAITILIAPVT